MGKRKELSQSQLRLVRWHVETALEVLEELTPEEDAEEKLA